MEPETGDELKNFGSNKKNTNVGVLVCMCEESFMEEWCWNDKWILAYA